MLLRSSRQATQLTKEALVGKILGAGAKAGLNQLGRAGRFAVNNPRAALGGVVGTTAGGIEVAKGLRRSERGFNPAVQALRRHGYLEQGLPSATERLFSGMKTRREMARRMGIL